MEQRDKSYLIRLASGGFYKKRVFRQRFNKVVKDGDDLLEFLKIILELRGNGQTIKKSVLNWIYSKDPKLVEKELSKSFKDFDGLTVLRLFHPKPINKQYQKAFKNIKNNCTKLRQTKNI